MRIGVLISGRGSNLKSLMEAVAAPDFPAEIALVISNRPGAGGLEHAYEANIPTATIDHKAYESREAFEADVHDALSEDKIDLVVLAGFMRVLTDSFVEKWEGRIVNIHPSLLPSFPGIRVHEQAIEAGVKISGATVHYVVPELDAGPIIGQAAVPVLEDDTPDTLAARTLEAEHKLYPACIRLIAEGKARMEKGRAVIDARPGDFQIFNPAG